MKLGLSLYRNSRGVVIGDLYRDEQRLLATTHPATIAAAFFAMDEYGFTFKSAKGKGEFTFPMETDELDDLAKLLNDQEEGNFLSLLATFSRFDFANPMPGDTQADIHFRTAVHHLPKQLLKVLPSEPEAKEFKKELRNRNKYVYFPYC